MGEYVFTVWVFESIGMVKYWYVRVLIWDSIGLLGMYIGLQPEFQKAGILGSMIPDIILKKSRHFWLKPQI